MPPEMAPPPTITISAGIQKRAARPTIDRIRSSRSRALRVSLMRWSVYTMVPLEARLERAHVVPRERLHVPHRLEPEAAHVVGVVHALIVGADEHGDARLLLLLGDQPSEVAHHLERHLRIARAVADRDARRAAGVVELAELDEVVAPHLDLDVVAHRLDGERGIALELARVDAVLL